jgi:ABC-type amino acid transport substrate-binding protein
MKKILVIFISVILVYLSACTKSCSKSCNADTKASGRDAKAKNSVLRIGTNANLPPFESINERGELVGFDIDVARAIGEKLHRRVEFKEFDFDALILALNKGQIDVILSGMSITESRQKEIAMVPYQGEPLTEISFLFWQSAPDNITNFSDIKNQALAKRLSISVQAGHYLENFLKDQGIPLKLLAGPPEQILDIKYNKSLAAAVDITVGKKLAAEHKGIKNIILPLPKDKWDLGNGIGIKKSRTELIAEITEAVSALNQDGTIKTLADKWLKDGK